MLRTETAFSGGSVIVSPTATAASLQDGGHLSHTHTHLNNITPFINMKTRHTVFIGLAEISVGLEKQRL